MRISGILFPLIVLFFPYDTFAQWVQTNGPDGGYVTCFATSDSVVLAGTLGSGVFLSTDNGLSWNAINRGLSAPGYGANGSGDPTVVQLGLSGRFFFAVFDNGAFFLSSDRGQTWTLKSMGVAGLRDNIIALVNADSDIYLGDVQHGVFLSTDEGITWNSINQGLTDLRVTALATLGSNIFVATQTGVFLSTNRGTHWSAANAGLGRGYVSVFAVSDSMIFAAEPGYDLYASSDSGKSWHPTSPTPLPFYARDFGGLAASGSCLYAADWDAIQRSTDSGRTWERSGQHFGITFRVLASSVSTVFAGSRGNGILRSTDEGLAWEVANKGLPGSNISRLVALDWTLFAPFWSSGMARSTDGGESWTVTHQDQLIQPCSPVKLGSKLIVSSWERGLFASADRGVSWKPYGVNVGRLNITALAGLDSNLFIATIDDGVYCVGQSGLFKIGPDSMMINSVTTIGTKVFATGGNGIYVINKHGQGWDLSLSYWKSSREGNISALVGSGSNLFAGTGPTGVIRSTDEGANWKAVGPGLGQAGGLDFPANSLVLEGQNLLAGTLGGVYISRDLGASWKQVNEGMTTLDHFLNVGALAIFDSHLFASLYCEGVWRRPLSELVPLNPNLIQNPGFESGMEPWVFYTNGSGEFSDSGLGPNSPHAAKVAIAASGDNVQLYQTDIHLKMHTRYRLSFKAYSNSAHRLSGFLHKHGPPYTSYGLEDWICDLGSPWKTFMREFTTENIADSVTDARLRFWFAQYARPGDEYFIDDVELVETEPHMITNGDFEWETNGWEFYTDGTGSFDTSPEIDASNHAAHIKIDMPGTNVQFYQSSLSLVEGARYRLSFKAYSTSGHSLSVYLHKHGTPYSNYGLEWTSLALTGSWQTYAKEFTAAGFSGMVTDARLRFWFSPFAKAGDEYYFDDVNLTRIDRGSGSNLVASAETSEDDIPEEFALFQNYPNPFNPRTVVRSQIPEASNVRIVIYDVLGREVAVLVNERRAAGKYEDTFDGSGLSSGIYVCRMTAGAYIHSVRMLLIK